GGGGGGGGGGVGLPKGAVLARGAGSAGLTRAVPRARLGGGGPPVGRPAMRRLSGFVLVEVVLALAILVIVAAMNVTPPARHEPPAWPFAFRLSLPALEGRAAEATRALIGSQIGVIRLVAPHTAPPLRASAVPPR